MSSFTKSWLASTVIGLGGWLTAVLQTGLNTATYITGITLAVQRIVSWLLPNTPVVK